MRPANNILAIIQARMGSSRLPGKTIANISDKPLLQHIIERVSFCKSIGGIVVATTGKTEDDIIVALSDSLNIETYRGSDSDVLDRYYQSATRQHADIIVRVTADDPFKDPEIIDLMVNEMLASECCDYVSNTIKPTYPEGIDTEVFTREALERAWKEAKLPSEREHVTPYIWGNPKLFSVKNIENSVDLSYFRWTLDYAEDLAFAIEIYNRLYSPGKVFLMKDILDLLIREPKLMKINSHIEKYSGYKKSLLEDGFI